MAIQYGSTEGHLRVGIDVDVEVNTATYQRVKFSFYADTEPDGWGWNDDMAMHISGHVGSSTVNFHKGGQNNQLIATRTVTRDKGSSTSNIVASCTISGAFNGATPSVTRSHTVPAKDLDQPKPPTAGSLDVVDVWDSGATLGWGTSGDTNGAPVVEYNCQVRVGSTLVKSEYLTGRRVVIGGLDPGTRHLFQVRCRNSQGWGAFSAFKDFTTDYRKPNAPGGLNTTGIFATIATMNWNAPFNGGDDLIQYEIRYRAKGTSSYTIREVWAQDQSFYTATGLAPGTTYEFIVRASNSAGWSDFSGSSEFTTASLWPDAPPRPTVSNIGLTTGRVTWSAAPPRGATITGYEVQWSVNSSFSSPSGSGTLGASVRSYDMSGLSAGTQYYVRVRAKSSEGDGNWSPSRSFATTGLTIPYPVVRYWTGGGWSRLNPTAIWDGEDWTELDGIKVWDGSTWVDITGEPY